MVLCCSSVHITPRRYKQRVQLVIHVLLGFFLVELVVMAQMLRGAEPPGEPGRLPSVGSIGGALSRGAEPVKFTSDGVGPPAAAARAEVEDAAGQVVAPVLLDEASGRAPANSVADADDRDSGVAVADEVASHAQRAAADRAQAGVKSEDDAAPPRPSPPSPPARPPRPGAEPRAQRDGLGSAIARIEATLPKPKAEPPAEPHVSELNPAKQSYGAGPPASAFWSKWRENTKRLDFAPDAAELALRPLLHFVMIVKNEARAMRETIESVRPYVDRYTILDTGSTDGTQDIVREAFGSVPGEVYEEPFVDFSTTRNRVIELAGTRCVFVLMLSGDESLRMGSALRAFLEQHRSWDWVTKDRSHEAYNIQVKYGSDVYDSTRIHRSDAAWYYVGVTHEYMTNARKQVATRRAVASTGVTPYIYHDISHSDPAGKRRRWQMDLELLLGEWERRPNTTRTAFYVAQTYECLHDYPNALTWYERRYELKGWNEEAYEAKFRSGRVKKYLGRPWTEVQQTWLDAHSYLPSRAEPLYAIASHYFHRLRDYPLAFLFAQRAAQLPFPAHLRLFIDKPVYDFKAHDLLGIVAFYVKEYEVGEAAVRRALRLSPDDKRLQRNLGFYLKRKQEIDDILKRRSLDSPDPRPAAAAAAGAAAPAAPKRR